MDIEFEWDENKNRLNQQKHGICFEDALYVFADLSRWDAQDARKDYGEERRITIGLMDVRVCVVSYTVRGEVVRLISARRANEREQKKYRAAQS